jgi:hypothetical protein
VSRGLAAGRRHSRGPKEGQVQMMARLRRRLAPDESVLGSVVGRLGGSGRRHRVLLVVTDRRVLVAARDGSVCRSWAYGELRGGDVAADGAADLRIGRGEEELSVVELSPAGQAAVLGLVRERIGG